MEGKVAIYGNEALYNVNVVAVIPSLGKDSSKKNDWQGQNRKKKAAPGFGELLQSEKDKNNQDMIVSTSSYSRDAKMVQFIYRMHEYSI